MRRKLRRSFIIKTIGCLVLLYLLYPLVGLKFYGDITKNTENEADDIIKKIVLREVNEIRNTTVVGKETQGIELRDRTTQSHKRNQELLPNLEELDGPGSNGNKLDVSFLKDDPMYDALRNKSLFHGVNVFLSNIIGPVRVLKDLRPELCKSIVYPNDLPQISIVIVCREETINTLARTIFGALYTCPKHLLKEIVIVDDGSVNQELLVALKLYEHYIEKVRVIRNEVSVGLMRARTKGILATTSDYFVVIDSHLEFNVGWVEPILYRLVKEPNNLLQSQIGFINMDNFEYGVASSDNGFICFEQTSVNEQWASYKDEYKRRHNNSVDPFEICMVQGMMMAMRKAFFLQLGGLDTGMEIWGSEHMEMSTKVWRCGGKVETVTCSLAAHLFRAQPWQQIHQTSHHIYKNKLRFTDVWMDGVPKQIAMALLGRIRPPIDPGDVSERRKIITDNNCKGYDYFVNKIKSLTDDIYFPERPQAFGEIYCKEKDRCLDVKFYPDPVTLITYQCTGRENQFFVMTEDGQIKVKTSWFALGGTNQDSVRIVRDVKTWMNDPQFLWKYTSDGEIVNTLVNKCITVLNNGDTMLDYCNKTTSQRFKWPLLTSRVET